MIVFMGLTATAYTQEQASYKVDLKYKAYWAGFVIAEITSQTSLTPSEYELRAHYQVKGIATMFNESTNNTMARGILNQNGEYRPKLYESVGNFGKLEYSNRAQFDPDTLKVTDHEQELTLREHLEYIPIDEEDKFGFDPMTLFLNMIMNPNFNEDYKEEYKERQFGGIFVSEQSFICDEQVVIERESRSVFQGDATVCKIDGERLAGGLKNTDPDRKRKKDRVDDDRDSRLWFGKMDGFDGMIPVYTEFPIGWGKIRIYLSDFSVEPIDELAVMAENVKPDILN